MRAGDVLGHEFMGEIVEVVREVTEVRKGDLVVVPSFISCGKCWYCERDLYTLCDTAHAKPELQEPLLGYPTAGMYAYSHAFGGSAGAHAKYVRMPFANTDCFVVPEGVFDEALFIFDAAPTGFMGADFFNIERDDVIAVWGCGGVGLMAQQSARILGAERVIAIDRYPERLAQAAPFGATTLD